MVVKHSYAGPTSNPAGSRRRLFPALERVGLAWEKGDLSVASERAASKAVIRRLAMFYEAASREAKSEVVVGLPPGARHDLGALAFATAARRLGVGVLFLGADVPVDSWLSSVVESGARGAVVAIPTAADAPQAAQVLRALQNGPSGLLCLAGGAGTIALPAGLQNLLLPRSITSAARQLTDLLDRQP